MCAVKCEKFHFNWITSFILANRRRHARRHSEGEELAARWEEDNETAWQMLSIADVAVAVAVNRAANAFSTRFECDAQNQATSNQENQ